VVGVYAICFVEWELKLKHRSNLHGEVFFHLSSEHGRPVDSQCEFLAVCPFMIISQRYHNFIFSDHINFHRIEHERSSSRFKPDEIEIGDDAPPHTDRTAVRVDDLRNLKVFILVETHVIIY
jgi:hypothetical protein